MKRPKQGTSAKKRGAPKSYRLSAEPRQFIATDGSPTLRVDRRLPVEAGEFVALPEATLLSDTSSDEAMEYAARGLAKRFPLPTMNPQAKQRLKVLAAKAGKRKPPEVAEWYRSTLCVPAILQAAKERRDAQPYRIGRKWPNHSRAPIVPMEQSWPIFRKWLRDRALRIIDDWLCPRGKPVKQPEDPPPS